MRGGIFQLPGGACSTRIVAAGTPPVRRTVSTTATTRSPVAIRPSPGVDALYAPRRTVLDPVLVDAAVAAGAEVRFGIAVTGLLRDEAGRVIGVTGRDRTGAAGPPAPASSSAPTAAVARWPTPSRAADPARRHAAARGHLRLLVGAARRRLRVVLPARRQRRRSSPPTTADAACSSARPPARTAALVRGRRPRSARSPGSPRTAASTAAFAPAGAPAVAHVRGQPGTPPLRGRGWALVGDAGVLEDPLSTHGMTDALRDAELLAGRPSRLLRSRGPTSSPRWPATRRCATGWQRRCSPSANASPRTTGTSSRCASSSWRCRRRWPTSSS